MFETLGSAAHRLRNVVAGFDPADLSGDEAAQLVDLFVEIERLAAAGRTLAARRVARSTVWQREGHRTAATWLATRTGDSVGRAIRTLETAALLEQLPRTEASMRKGTISESQAYHVAAGAAADPSSEGKLLDAASTLSLNGLRRESLRVRAAAEPNERARYEAIRRSRYLRSWTEPDGAFRLDARLTPDDGAAVWAVIATHRDRLIRQARKAGRREPYQAYAADALVDIAHAACDGSGDQRQGGPRAMVHVLVDHAALTRGHVGSGERCEIPGVGPIPVATARALLSDSILKVLVTDGVDIKAVAHAGRTIPSHLRTALEVRDRSCAIVDCDVTERLQIDHIQPFADGGPTTLENLRRHCPWHHHLKTHCGYRIEGEPGAAVLITPDNQEAARPPPAA